MFGAIARFVTGRRTVVIALYILLVPVALALAGSVLPLLKAGGFEDSNRESWQAFEVIQREFGAGTGDIIALYTIPNGSVGDPIVTASIRAVISRLEQEPEVGAIQSLYNTGAPLFMSPDGTRTFLLIDLFGDEQKKIETFLRLKPAFLVDDLSVQFGGLIPTNYSVFETIRSDLIRAELLVFPLTALIVFLVFRSPVAVAILLAVGGCGILFALAALRAIVAVTDVSVFALNTIMLLGLGLSVDYSLFLVSRFREELAGRGVEGAIIRTMETTGRAIAFSGFIVVASLCGLFVFDQAVLRSLGLGGIAVVLGTVVLALTLTPALLAIVGEHIDKWRYSLPLLDHDTPVQDNLWHRTALAAIKRPVLVAAVVAALLLSLALPFSRFSGTMVDWRALPAGDPVRVTNEILDTEFAPNQGTPHLVLVTMPGDAMAPDNLKRLAALAKHVSEIAGITRVDSLFTLLPDLSIDEAVDLLLDRDPGNAQQEAVLTNFVTGPWMRFGLLSAEPFDASLSQEQVRALRALSTPEMRVEVAGYAAALFDLKAAVRERTPLMVLLVMTVMFVILFFAFGSITLPVKALVANALSLTASFGAIVWIFQDGRLQSLLDYTSLGFSDMTLPLVMFAIVFGVSMDYEVMLLSRVREEYVRSGDNTTAVAQGIARTGHLITSAGMLLVVVVAAFATSKMVFMKALGTGMALAIILDVTLVRALLVPATMRLMGRWNWYAPAPLARLWKESGIGDVAR
jgi:RND superfamily putative drug exporter